LVVISFLWTLTPPLQASLRISLGGLGLQRFEWLAPGAYAGSWASYLYNARRLKVITDNHIQAIAEGTSTTLFCSIMEADDLITCSLPEAPSMLGSCPVTEAPTNIQHQLYDFKQHAKSQELFSEVSQRHQARPTALQGKVPFGYK